MAGIGAAVVALLAAGVVGATTRGGGHGSNGHGSNGHGSKSSGRDVGAVLALRDEPDQVSVSVPANWRSPALEQGSYADTVQAFAVNNPQFSSVVAQRATKAAASVGLFAVDPRSHTTLVIESAPAAPNAISGAAATGVLPALLIDQFRRLGIQVLHTGTVQLPLGPVLHAALGLVVGGEDLVADQYFLVEGAKAITVTIEGPGGAGNLAVHQQIAQSIHR